MIRLSSSPDIHFLKMIKNVKFNLILDSPSTYASPELDFSPLHFPHHLHGCHHDWEWDEDFNFDQVDSVHSAPGDFYNNSNYSHPRAKKSPSLPEFPFKMCNYFMKGLCKYGKNCKYIHATHMDKDRVSVMFTSNPNSNPDYQYQYQDQDHVFYSPSSLDNLELELIQLLRSRKGDPISIAALPMVYLDMYGRTLQAEGYLTESQRNGKAGFSLTRLLGRLPSILVLDRPHGQHSVVLAEDGPRYKYADLLREKKEQRLSNSRQVYLTFPAESIFTERDVSNYFNTIGPVETVRIPNQLRRMYGFVAFVFADTVTQILSKGKLHMVCGTQVIVKKYMDKHQLIQKKLRERIHQQYSYYDSAYPFTHADYQMFQQMAIEGFKISRFHEKRMDEQHSLSHPSYNDDWKLKLSVDEAWKRESMHMATTRNSFNYQPDPINHGGWNDQEQVKQARTSEVADYDQDDHSDLGLNLPETPFAYYLPELE